MAIRPSAPTFSFIILTMAETEQTNELYLVVLPMISVESGKAEEMMTLMGEKSLATEFFPDEVEGYELMFRNRAKYFRGGHVTGYEFSQERTDSGRIVVKVKQNVA
jgi:hypothetical protein